MLNFKVIKNHFKNQNLSIHLKNIEIIFCLFSNELPIYRENIYPKKFKNLWLDLKHMKIEKLSDLNDA